jgi:hypothetical protein
MSVIMRGDIDGKQDAQKLKGFYNETAPNSDVTYSE